MEQMPNSEQNADLTTSAPTCHNTMLAEVAFSWKHHSSWVTRKSSERHYKCQITGSFKCVEYKGDSFLGNSKFKCQSFSLPNSHDYGIESEEELIKLLKK
jgi:hypothetical protein